MDYNTLVEKACVYLGQPVDPNLKVPVALGEVADVTTVPAGEIVKVFDDDTATDNIYTVNANGVISVHKLSKAAASELTFAHYNTKLEYILVNELLDAEDQGYLMRKKASFTRALDKLEVKRVVTLCESLTNQAVLQGSGDVFDVIRAMLEKIEDYGDNYILLVGTTTNSLINSYDKDNADNFHYDVGLKKWLVDNKITPIKLVGKLNVDGGGENPLIGSDDAILIARNSSIADGKPIKFVRRMIDPAIAEMMGVKPDEAQRAIFISNTPVPVSAGSLNTLAFGAYAYESVILACTNSRAISFCLAIS